MFRTGQIDSRNATAGQAEVGQNNNRFEPGRHLRSAPLAAVAFLAVFGLAATEAPAAQAAEADKAETGLAPVSASDQVLPAKTVKTSKLDHRVDFVSHSDMTLTGVTVEARFVSGPDGEVVSPRVNGQNGIATLAAVEPKAVAVVRITADLPVPGDYHFVVETKSPERKVYRLAVTRTAPKLTIGKTDNAQITLTPNDESFRHRLWLYATEDADAANVTVEVNGLTGPNGKAAPLKFENGMARKTFAEVRAAASHPLDLEARLTESGDYVGEVRLIYHGAVKVYPIKITKSLVPVTISASAAADHATLQGGAATIELQVSVQENGGKSVQLREPSLKELKTKLADTSENGARYDKAVFSLDGKAIGSDELPTVELLPGSSKNIAVQIVGVPAPGQYSGKIVFDAVDRKPLEQDISFVVRRSIGVAGVIILAGIVLSWLLRFWGNVWQPRIRQAQQIVDALAKYGQLEVRLGILSPEERDVFAQIKDQLRDLYDGLRLGSASDVKERITDYQSKTLILKDWALIGRQLQQLGSRAADLADELRPVRQLLLNPDADTTARESASTVLKALPGKIKTRIKAMQAELITQLKSLEPELADKSLHTEWQSEVIETLDKAQSLIDADNWVAAREMLDGIRRAAARILATDLAKRDEGQPPGMSSAAFARMERSMERARKDTDGARALTAYRSALSLYLQGMATELTRRVESGIAEFERRIAEGGDAALLQAAITKLSAHRAPLKTVPALLASDDLDNVRQICTSASDELDGLKDLLAAQKFETLTRATPAMAPIARDAAAVDKNTVSPGGAGLDDSPLPVPLPNIDLGDPATTGEKLQRWGVAGDFVYNLVVMVIAVALGLFVLWAKDLDWGSPADMLYAALWGLGLHALTTSNTAYAGVTDLVSKLK